MKKSKSRNIFLQIEQKELHRLFEQSVKDLFIEIIVTHANVKINIKTSKQEKVKFSRNNLLESI